ncbi:beta-lactamase class A [Streptoalloteichus tenebrarius]|uniref:Beta-lactamase class A n=1 Tax=Streptoalloteichus tenebrarius (strain ATCC 17920 / DSM 40477 / JCM 4838 / CBS 697.72 / NBRC 16177 / NCIMB 11028 / NRRL B-12390 / A12253. 1 / ISP 5477) TaxID=1933 RepID=A0ABT1HMD2_STRSD|nr:serine hydrolase [Streptoalloteichus tenebrarius]MCP2256644.1 beta-lactamase class A [Streptoalloteichus tenebrarius]BFF04997.1 serine hydrolase [Streptoalloteichus tenebrarius]
MRQRRPECLASTPDLLPVAEAIAEQWHEVGALGHLLARNIDTGEELGFDVDTAVPLASVAKVPLALVVLDEIAEGALDPAMPVTLDPATKSVGPTGVAAFRHPATVAVVDLVHQALTVSDNASADALFDLVGVEVVDQRLRAWGCEGIRIRHRMQRMYDCAAGVSNNDFGLALELAIRDDIAGHHSIETLNPAYANVGSASALVALLQRVWLDRISRPEATADLRRMMGLQVFNQRLSSDLRADTVRVSGKTGSFLYLRHEIGVVTADSGDRVAIAALTRSHRRASIAHDIDLAIGAAARAAFESLRR